MKKTNSVKRLAYAGIVLWFGLVSCGLLTTSVSDVKTESQAVKLKSATSANIRIDFPVGELKISNGADNLMTAKFRYNIAAWKPEVTYSEKNAQGELRVNSSGSRRMPFGRELINDWEILLSDEIPIDLHIRTGVGNSQLDLGSLDLISLTIETGVGNTTVDLDGVWQHNVDVSIQGGLGNLTVNLPAEMGVRVDMETALVNVTSKGLSQDENGYVNQAFGTAPHNLTLELQAGVGQIALVVP